MSKRDSELYISDILESITAINKYLEDIKYEDFCNDRKTYSATIREFTIIGEAISKVIDTLPSRKIPRLSMESSQRF